MTISVVIPAFNEEAFIAKPLASLAKQTHPPDEIIVVNNNSTDNTASIAKKYHSIVITRSLKGVGMARQAGFEKAKGDIIATTDADTIVPSDWIETILSHFEKDPHLVAFGGLYSLYSGPNTAKLGVDFLSYPVFLIDRILSGGWTLHGANMAMRKTAFEKVGGYNTSLQISEDTELSLRLNTQGNVVLDKNFKVMCSGRRYNNGFLRGQMDLAPSVFMRMVFKKYPHTKLPSVRTEATD